MIPQRLSPLRYALGAFQSATTAQKLALAFVMFLAPLGYMAPKLIDMQKQRVSEIAQMRAGLAYLEVVNKVIPLVSVQEYADILGSADSDAVSAALAALRQAEARYGAELKTANLTRRAMDALEAARNNNAARKTAAISARLALEDLARWIGQFSYLAATRDYSQHVSTVIISERAPQNGQISRDVANQMMFALADGRLSRAERDEVERLLVLMEDHITTLSSLSEHVSQHAEDTIVAADISRQTYTVAADFAAYRDQVRDALRRGRVAPSDIVNADINLQFSSAALAQTIASNTDRRLNVEADAAMRELVATLAIAGGLFVFALFAVTALLRASLVAPLKRLVDATREIAAGRYDTEISAIARSDEIGELARALAVLRDDAQAKIASDAARAAAEGANTAKSQFIATMSHELRTPLNAIIGYAEILIEDAEESGDDAAQADLKRIISSARHLLALINDILDMSKIEAGRMEIHAETCDPHALIEDIVATAAPLASVHNNTLTWDLADIRDARLDVQKLRQCLLNLLSNACKFTKEGAVSISMREEYSDGRAYLKLAVSDTGIGISAEQRERLFQPFAQASSLITRDFGGTGLGLAITQRLADLMEGGINLVSEPGAGSTFTLRIPRYYDEATGDTCEIEDRIYGDAHAPLIVIIEDHACASDLAARVLEPLGFSVRCAETAAAGVRLIDEADPCLIVLDLNLPDADGLTLLAQLSANPATASIPVLVHSIEEDRRRSLSHGAAEHLVKPVSRDVLCAAVLRLARARPRTGEATQARADADRAA